MRGAVDHILRGHQQCLEKRAEFRVPVRFEDRAKFDAVESWLSTAKGKAALAHCRRFAAAPREVASPLLMGRSGAGKTHLLYATARAIHEAARRRLDQFRREHEERALAEIGRDGATALRAANVASMAWPATVLHVTSGAEIAHALRESVPRQKLDETVAFFRQEVAISMRWTGVLVVDDVEVAKMSDFLDVELYRIFDYRYQESLPTLVATNLAPPEMARQLGDRIARRIVDMTEPFEL